MELRITREEAQAFGFMYHDRVRAAKEVMKIAQKLLDSAEKAEASYKEYLCDCVIRGEDSESAYNQRCTFLDYDDAYDDALWKLQEAIEDMDDEEAVYLDDIAPFSFLE